MTSSALDPIFPLPAGTAIPPVKHGEGQAVFQNDQIIPGTDLSHRAFYVMWEQVELRATQNYPKYVGGPHDYVAQTWLEALVFCRRIGNPLVEIDVISEKKAKKIRAKEAEELKKKQEAAAKARAAKGGKKQKDSGDMVPEGPLSVDPVGLGGDDICSKCSSEEILKAKKRGVKMWKCADCGHTWPRRDPQKATTPPTSRSKASKEGRGSQSPDKKKPASSKKKKRAKKGS